MFDTIAAEKAALEARLAQLAKASALEQEAQQLGYTLQPLNAQPQLLVLTSPQFTRTYPTDKLVLQVVEEGNSATSDEIADRIHKHGGFRKLTGGFKLLRHRVVGACAKLEKQGLLVRVGDAKHNQRWLRPTTKQPLTMAAAASR